MAAINLNKLIEDRKPVMELELNEVVYPIYAYEYLPTGVTARVTEVNAYYESVNEEVLRFFANIDPQIADLNMKKATLNTPDADIEAKLTRLYAARVAQEARLLRPLRELIEALANMPSGSLEDFPTTVLTSLYDEINTKVFASLGKKVEAEKKAATPPPPVAPEIAPAEVAPAEVAPAVPTPTITSPL